MKILMVFHAPPWPPEIGPARRHYHELVELLARGHRVSVLSYGTDDQRRHFLASLGSRCERVRFVPLHRSRATQTLTRMWHFATTRSDFARLCTRRLQYALDAMVREDRYDVVSFSTTLLGRLRLPEGLPRVGDTHNVEFDIFRRAFEATPGMLRHYFRVQAALTKRLEVACTRRFDVVCTTSERDRRMLQQAIPDARIAVVPNGVDLDAHEFHHGPRERGAILFTGLMSYYPNQHGVTRFVRDVFPLVLARVPHARLLIVGANPPACVRRLASGNVLVSGYVPDVRPYFRRADAYVIPLSIGGGTRVKALQAMAMGLPIVSTRLGCEGLNVEHGREVMIADDPAEFAAALVRVMEDDALRGMLTRQAAQTVRAYSWTRVGDRFNDVLAQAAAGNRIPHLSSLIVNPSSLNPSSLNPSSVNPPSLNPSSQIPDH